MKVQDNLLVALRCAAKTGDFTLASGKKSDLYIDCREVTTQSYHLGLASVRLKNAAAALKATVLAGPASASISLMATACVDLKQLRGFVYTRTKPKEHGTQQAVDGIKLKSTDKVLLVDDVLTSGGSLITCRNILLEKYPKLDIVGAWVLVDRAEGGRDRLMHEGIRTHAAYDRMDLLPMKKTT